MHFYSALLCIVVHPKRFTIMWGGLSSTTTSVQHSLGWCDGCHSTTAPVRSPHTSYRWRGERVIEPIKCMLSPHTSYRWRGERVIEPIKCMLSPHTSYRWRGERVIEPIKCMHSPHTSYRWRGERVIEPIKWMLSPHTSYRWRGERESIEPIKWMLSPHTSYRWRGERVIEPIKCMLSPHTSYRWRGERVIEPIKWMGIIRRPWSTRASGGNLARTLGLHPTLYENCHGIFNDHRVSGPRFNVSSERWCFLTGALLGPKQTAGWAPPAGLTNTSTNSNLVFPVRSSIQVLTRLNPA